jgi:transposase-like protein
LIQLAVPRRCSSAPATARLLPRARYAGPFIDEVFAKIKGKRHYLWRAVDQDGEVVDVYRFMATLR